MEKNDPKSYLPRFKLNAFRPGQEEVITTVLSGQDCLCVMPTGGGKSLCYQLPALALDGLTLVVSPLIALMKDQVDQLHALGLPVTFINSTLSLAEQYERFERIAAGEFRLVYVVPERFRSQRFLETVSARGVKLLAIDEAHCVSQWGHDFRPDYARLGHFRRKLGRPPAIALTATATDAVRRDIIEQLDLVDPRTFITGFARDNLFYEVQHPHNDREKGEKLVHFLHKTSGSGIVYASTRKRAEEVAELIAASTKRTAAVYHAGMAPDERRGVQESFMAGKTEIIAATTAFGMGIDKADVRFVVHYNLPGTLEAYYQEAGRAGRDARQSHCLMLYSPSDRYIQEYFIESAYPAKENVAKVYEHLRRQEADPIELTQQEIKQELSLPIGADGVGTCEQLLEGAGVLERLVAANNLASVRLDSDLPTLVDMLPKQAKNRRAVLAAVENIVGDRRDELVAFNPLELQRATGLPHAAVTAALRQLGELPPFTYVPPFRGRAIRMIRRDLPFSQLDIDFAALEARKAAEYEKLRKVIYFAMGEQCRQQNILRYFGEKNAPPCGHCDNCKNGAARHLPREKPHEAASAAANATGGDDEVIRFETPVDDAARAKLLEAVRIALSGVARVKRERGFDCGKNLIAQMLCGSSSARMEKLNLNKLSTFGLLSALRQNEVEMLLEAMINAKLLSQTRIEPGRPVLQITPEGAEVMSGKKPLDDDLPIPDHLVWKIAGEPQAAGQPDAAGMPLVAGQPVHDRTEKDHGQTSSPCLPAATVDPALLTRLQDWRLRRSREAGLPAYCILHNTTLEEIARRQPNSLGQLEALKGMGQKKVEQYGAELLAVVAASDSQNLQTVPLAAGQPVHDRTEQNHGPTSSPCRPAETQNTSTPLDRPGYYWTWILLKKGFSIAECAAIRGLEENIILQHAREAAKNGYPVQDEYLKKG